MTPYANNTKEYRYDVDLEGRLQYNATTGTIRSIRRLAVHVAPPFLRAEGSIF